MPTSRFSTVKSKARYNIELIDRFVIGIVASNVVSNGVNLCIDSCQFNIETDKTKTLKLKNLSECFNLILN